MYAREWERKGVDFSGEAMKLAKQMGLTLDAAQILKCKLADAFDKGIRWQERRQRQIIAEKAAKAKRPRGRPEACR